VFFGLASPFITIHSINRLMLLSSGKLSLYEVRFSRNLTKSVSVFYSFVLNYSFVIQLAKKQ